MADETLVRRDLEQQLINRAWKDPDFRQELLKNPREAIKRELGLPIPEGITIAIHEESPSTVHIVLPVNPTEQAITELSDAELAGIAGGAIWEGGDNYTEKYIAGSACTCMPSAGSRG